MLRKTLKRPQPNQDEPIGNKKRKIIPPKVPVPVHISLTPEKIISYHFSKDADLFLQHLQSLPALQNTDINSVKVHLESCFHNPKQKCCGVVNLTSKQFNAWLGPQAYNQLALVDQLYKKWNSLPHLTAQLEQLNSRLANQAALLMDEGWMLLDSICNDSEEIPTWRIIPFLHLLQAETINQAALHFMPANNEYVLMRWLTLLNSEAALLLLSPITDSIYNQLALEQNYNGFNLLIYAASNQPPEIFNLVVNKLTRDICNQAALQRANVKDTPSLLEYIAKFQPGIVFKRFCDTLTLETRLATVFQLRADDHFDQQAAVNLLSSALQQPRALNKYVSNVPQLTSIEFFDSGNSVDKWSKISESSISCTPITHKRPEHLDLTSVLAPTTRKHDLRETDYLNKLSSEGWEFLRVQGRTILLQNKKGILRAVKVQKKEETPGDLFREFETTQYLNKNAKKLRLQSTFPNPVLVNQIRRVENWLQDKLSEHDYAEFMKLMPENQSKTAYVYDVDPNKCDYFTYLHDPKLSKEVFNQANRIVINDLFRLLQQGVIFPQLADLFHNLEHIHERKDVGRYMVLVNILRNFKYRGSGRLTGWDQGVRFPNVRPNGLADLGDRVSINEYLAADGKMVVNYYQETRELYRDAAGNYLLANVMAEYQYVLFLIAGCRGYQLTDQAKANGESAESINLIWLELAQQILDNCIHAAAILTHQNEIEIGKILHALVDVNRLARQMHYWMTYDYVPDLMQNKIPPGIYEEGTQITVDINRFRKNTFSPIIGFAIDGEHQDLGPVNGQEPIKEANKLFYWMAAIIFTSYNLLQLTVKDLISLKNVKDINHSERLRSQLFNHLPKKEYHHLQHQLCEERVIQKNLPEDMRKKVKAESVEHKTAYAALTIQNFWRNNRKLNAPSSEPASKNRMQH